jgi:hypothetical protein
MKVVTSLGRCCTWQWVRSIWASFWRPFDRFTDERWEDLVEARDLPERPDWVNIYLADSLGVAFFAGRQLPGITHTDVGTNDSEDLPQHFRLSQNYPNPFNPVTTLRYTLPTAQYVTLRIYDLAGRETATLVKKHQPAGEYQLRFNAGELPSGIYLARLVAGVYHRTIKMVLMK